MSGGGVGRAFSHRAAGPCATLGSRLSLRAHPLLSLRLSCTGTPEAGKRARTATTRAASPCKKKPMQKGKMQPGAADKVGDGDEGSNGGDFVAGDLGSGNWGEKGRDPRKEAHRRACIEGKEKKDEKRRIQKVGLSARELPSLFWCASDGEWRCCFRVINQYWHQPETLVPWGTSP